VTAHLYKAVFILCFIASAVFKPATGFGQSIDPATVVDRFYPDALINGSTTHNLPTDRNECFVVYDLLPNGTPKTIMAGYTDNVVAMARVISWTGSDYAVSFEPEGISSGGIDCGVELVDVNGDGNNEVKYSFASFRGNTSDWIFAWDGHSLTNIGPSSGTSLGGHISELMNSAFFDINHDGTLQILSVGQNPPPSDDDEEVTPNTLYVLQNGKFVSNGAVLLLNRFLKQNENATAVTATFNTPSSVTGPFVLKITPIKSPRLGKNGRPDDDPVTGSISLNGVALVPSGILTATTISLPSLLATNNQLTVTLTGEEGSSVQLVIVPSSSH
jgi:hypothetical protein